MKTKAWNVYKNDGTGKLIVGMDHTDKYTVTTAIDEAEKYAKNWNKGKKHDSKDRVNFISCNGFVRVVI